MLKIILNFLFLTTIVLSVEAGRRKGALIESPESVEQESWSGNWFPHNPNDIGRKGALIKSPESVEEESWSGKWFPYNPTDKTAKRTKSKATKTITVCDDGKHAIGLDFDPANQTHSFNYLCLNNRTLYEPNLQREPVLTEHFIPPAYVAPVKCMNESISYVYDIPTFGPHRLVAPKYGSYKYLPPQRWLQSLADGAIVMLYHPCAFPGQITILENTLKGCLYRHIISPSQQLTPERPLALLSWGKLLQMSVVDDSTVVDFIKANAKHGPNVKRNEVLPLDSYEAGLLSESKLVTDEKDSEICGFKNM